MNQTPPPSRLRPFLPLLILLFISGLLSFFVQDFFTQIIFLPILEFFRYYYRLYLGLPQNLAWGGVVFIALLMGVYRLWPRFSNLSTAPAPSKPQNRLGQLAALRAQAENSDYARWELAREIEKLALLLLEIEHGEKAAVLQERVARNEIPLPEALNALFRACRAIPNYRTFIEARQSVGGRLARRQPITDLANLDLDAALAVVASWEDKA